MLSSFGIRAYPIFLESFLALAFNKFNLHHLPLDWGSGTYWRALEVGGKRGLTMFADAWADKSNRDRNEKPEV